LTYQTIGHSFVNIYFHRLSETPVSSSHMAD